MKRTINLKGLFGLIFTFFAFSFLLFFGKELSKSISETVLFCGKVLIPQLFLYLCFSSFLWEIGIIEGIIYTFPRFGAEISAFIFGLLLGFPSGALIVGKLCESGAITKKRGEYILTFSNNTGLSFVFGYVSLIVGMSGALSIFICQLLFSTVFAFFGQLFLSDEDKKTYFIKKTNEKKSSRVLSAIQSGTENMINLCAVVIIFSAISSLAFQISPELSGFIEMTTGVSSLSALPFDKSFFRCASYVCFGGICVYFQICSVCGVKTRKYLLTKTVSAILSPILATAIHFLITK